MAAVAGFEILEHTADVGVRAQGATLEEVFEQATLGLLHIAGISTAQEGREVLIEVGPAPDLCSLLVDWLSEILYLHDAQGVGVAELRVGRVDAGGAAGSAVLGPLRPDSAGTQVKAVTYHQLEVERGPQGWTARVFLDI